MRPGMRPAPRRALRRRRRGTEVSAFQTGKRISSRNTFFLKRIFPVLWFGIIALVLVAQLTLIRHSDRPPPPVVFLAPAILLLIGYFILRRLVFDLADAVYDEGDALRVRFGSEEERIPLADIINISCTTLTNPPRVTLTLRNPGRFGKEVTFSPPQRFLGAFRANPLVAELIERVDAARRR